MKKKNIYILSIIILLITAFFSTGYHHFDEHFQILEFAGLKLNMTVASNLPWEYHHQLRPALQPLIAVFLMKFLSIFGINNPFTIAFILRLLSAALAFIAMLLIYKNYENTITNEKLKKCFLLLSFFLWFMIYDSVRFSSENWSGSFFLIGFSLLNSKQNTSKYCYFLVGLIFGVSFLLRYQIGFLIFGMLSWVLVIERNFKKVALLSIGTIIFIGIGIIIDKWFYGEWTLTAWNYFWYFFDQNVINGIYKFSVDPWWYYFEKTFFQTIPPFSIVIILCFFLVFFLKRKDLLTWTIVPFLLIHFIISHKEMRFLFPIIGFIPILIIKSIEIVQEKWKQDFIETKFVKIFIKLFFIVNILILAIVAFKPANDQISMYNFIYSNFQCKTVLYYFDANPYHRVLDINFYKRQNLETKKISSINEIKPDSSTKQLIVVKDLKLLNQTSFKTKLIYSQFPQWIKKFNFNNWYEKLNSNYIYEIN
ncbi:MAG: hypothetical protein HXX09_06115 [Bacteroidetes bacterium]|nr:hypothetical protein [Bacteroidota bacterium]